MQSTQKEPAKASPCHRVSSEDSGTAIGIWTLNIPSTKQESHLFDGEGQEKGRCYQST
jgi:hypothetical protein